MKNHFSSAGLVMLLAFFSCSLSTPDSEVNESAQDFNSYWMQGKAEITSYKLSQARYGELREGTVVNVFVTEPWNEEAQVKSDRGGDALVLKLNSTKNFNTGIYPYSMMTSVFSDVATSKGEKVTCSSQEWCGHTFTQINRNEFEWQGKQFSYFESEGDDQFVLPNSIQLEDEIWNMIRLNPEQLPLGDITMLPSTNYLRLSHLDFDIYQASASLTKGASTSIYSINYPSIHRSVEITFSNAYPHVIDYWKETYSDGWGDQRKQLTTEARLMNREMIDYWNKNSNSDEYLREELGLD